VTFPTPQQREAIEAPLGPVLVLAGPGAGKTSCLVARIQYLVQRLGLRAERLCTVTFTNKAAEEIAHRLKGVLGREAEDITRGTIHSLCVRILRKHRSEVGLQAGFGIADEDYQHALLGRLRVPRKYRGGLLNRFGRQRLQGYELTPDDHALMEQYQERLHAANMVDFDDLVVLTAGLLTRRPDIAEPQASQWDYLLVDECQDLSARQYDIIRTLVAGHRNLFAVGDDEQSIFSWASADPLILRQLADDFSITRPIVLEENCRCSSRIFSAARRLIEKNPPLFDKALTARRDSPYEVEAFTFDDEHAEGGWLITHLAGDRHESGLPWGEYGILYRRHDSGTLLEGKLLAAGIPCRLSRGRAIGDDRIIRQVLASLRVMLRPDDEVALEALGDLLLPSMLMDQIRNHFIQGGFLTGLRVYARANKRAPDAKKAWRFIYAVENLRAIYRSHRTLRGLITGILSQGIGVYKNPLEAEEVSKQLTDPADYPGAADLSSQLQRVRRTGGRIWIPRRQGLELAIRGMLVRAGFTLISFGSSGESDDLVLDPAPGGGLALLLFKALQLEESLGWEEPQRNFVAFDLETTDNDIRGCEVVEIGAARVRDGAVVDTFQSLVRSDRPISPRATEVHGFRDSDLVGAPDFAEVWERFRVFAGTDILVAHNGLNFDVPVLLRMAHGLPGSTGLVFYDSLPLARSLSSLSARLEDLATQYGVETGRSHHALDDAVALAQIYGCLHRTRSLRARKAALTNLLDDLGLALALDRTPASGDFNVLWQISRGYTLGRFGESLDNYAKERYGEAPSVDEVIERLGGQQLMDRLRAERKPEERYPAVMARLETLVAASESPDLAQAVQTLLDRVALSSSDVEVERDRVNLLTLHATKGLEFSRVYVVGVEDHEMPGSQALTHHRLEEIEEARRLLYVGMTRAKDRLVLTRATVRRGAPSGESSFLSEIGLTEAGEG
jgi:superfamily I DNA/RNA helicase/DNA polymerase III epsilon subunit-like protein